MNNKTTNKGKQSQKVSLTAKVLLVLPSFSSILPCIGGEDNVSLGMLARRALSTLPLGSQAFPIEVT